MNRKLAFTFIILTLVIDAMGIGLIIPVMPDLLQYVSGGDLGNAALWGGILTTVFALTQFIFSPTLGNLSDRYGRRPILITSTAIVAVDYLIMGFAASIWLLIVLRIIGGIASSTHSTAAAFISDISSKQDRASNFGILGAAFGIGFVLGPVVGGILGEYYDFHAPFFAAAGLATCNLLLGLFILPETLTDATRRPFEWKRANPIGSLLQIKKLKGSVPLLVLLFFYEFAFFVYPAVWSYYTKEQFGWSPEMVGYSLAAYGISTAFVQGYLIRKILPAFGARKVLLFGFTYGLIIFALFAFITQAWMILLLIPISALGALTFPTLQGLISKTADDNAQGEIQGIISSIRSLAFLSSPIIMTTVFFAATRPNSAIYLPGAPFLVSFGFLLLCLFLFLAQPKNTLE